MPRQPRHSKNWGGKRFEGSTKWKHSPTKLVRIPEPLEAVILRHAHWIDEEVSPQLLQEILKADSTAKDELIILQYRMIVFLWREWVKEMTS